MDRALFDDWRNTYDIASDGAQIAFYNRLAVEHPKQQYYTEHLVDLFFDRFRAHSVFEVGGWQGEMAERILRRFPVAINRWVNKEISQIAARRSVCVDPRYCVWTTPHFKWWYHESYTGFDTAVISHTLEHFKSSHAMDILEFCEYADQIYLEVPVEEEGRKDWTGHMGSHILEMGWADIRDYLNKMKFKTEMQSKEVCFAWQ